MPPREPVECFAGGLDTGGEDSRSGTSPSAVFLASMADCPSEPSIVSAASVGAGSDAWVSSVRARNALFLVGF